MSDKHAQRTAGTDSSEPVASATDDETAGRSSDGLEPGGGPRRVVSERSVDEILDSLDATKSDSDSDSSEGAESSTSDPSGPATETLETTSVAFDEGDVPTADGSESDAADDTEAAEDAPPAATDAAVVSPPR